MTNQIRNPKSESGGREIVLANDPFGAFWRPLNKLAADNAKNGDGRPPQAGGFAIASEDVPATKEPYQMNGSAAIIPVIGPITKYPDFWDEMCGWTFTLNIQAAIAKALDDNAVEKIILFIDSPGGCVAGTPELADFIFEARKRKPIVAVVSDLCASGAFYLASQCSWIVANEAAFIGSIGVYCILTDYSKMAEEAGIRLILVSDGEYKGLNEPGLPIGDKATQEWQAIVTSMADLFRAAVGRGRNLAADVVIQLADGRVHVAAEALKLGLIDAIGTIDAALSDILGDQEMNTPTIVVSGKSTTIKPKAEDAGTEGAAGGEGAAPDVAELCTKILDAVNALTDLVKKIAPADGDAGGKKGDDDGKGGADDASAKADQSRLMAIMASCPGREKFATEQYLAGKTPIEAQAALATILQGELIEANRKIAADADGADPVRGAQPAGGGVRALSDADETDPETIWAKDIGGVKATYRGKKDYFLVAFNHGVTPAQIKAKAAAKAA